MEISDLFIFHSILPVSKLRKSVLLWRVKQFSLCSGVAQDYRYKITGSCSYYYYYNQNEYFKFPVLGSRSPICQNVILHLSFRCFLKYYFFRLSGENWNWTQQRMKQVQTYTYWKQICIKNWEWEFLEGLTGFSCLL